MVGSALFTLPTLLSVGAPPSRPVRLIEVRRLNRANAENTPFPGHLWVPAKGHFEPRPHHLLRARFTAGECAVHSSDLGNGGRWFGCQRSHRSQAETHVEARGALLPFAWRACGCLRMAILSPVLTACFALSFDYDPLNPPTSPSGDDGGHRLGCQRSQRSQSEAHVEVRGG